MRRNKKKKRKKKKKEKKMKKKGVKDEIKPKRNPPEHPGPVTPAVRRRDLRPGDVDPEVGSQLRDGAVDGRPPPAGIIPASLHHQSHLRGMPTEVLDSTVEFPKAERQSLKIIKSVKTRSPNSY